MKRREEFSSGWLITCYVIIETTFRLALMKNSQQPVTSTVSKVEEFLRFKQLQSQTSLASTLRTAHEERDSKHQLQDELQRLKHKTEAKQTELEQYKKSYEKLSLQVRDAIS